MKKSITFVKLMDRWFANLPELKDQIDIIDCEMVAGADLFIDILAKGKQIVSLTLAADEEIENPNGILTEESEVEGAGCGNYKAVILDEEDNELFCSLVWLCPVTTMVFGDYPKTIYFKYSV